MLARLSAPGGDVWTRYWRDGPRDGCTIGMPPPVRDAIDTTWRGLLQAAADRTARPRLLDVACGRGAVLDHALRTGRYATLIGVDRAALPRATADDFAIRGGVDARSLPYADGAFDVVTSQYGIEYADAVPAAIEAARACRHTLLLLVHASDGVIVAQAREQIAQADWIDGDLAGFAVLAETDPGTAARARLIAAVHARVGGADNGALLTGFAELAAALPRDPPLIARFAADWRDHATRLRDLVRVAPDRAAFARVADAVAAAGFAVERWSQRAAGGQLVGRWLAATREET